MFWFFVEHWFWIACLSACAIGFLYIRAAFGQKAAWAAGATGLAAIISAFFYRKGQDREREAMRQRAERDRQARQEVEKNVGAMGAEDVERELGKWNRD